MDPIDDLVADHREVQELLGQVEHGLADVDSAAVTHLCRELAIHAGAEEAVIYPAAKVTIPGGENLVATPLQEHQLVKELVATLERTRNRDDRSLLLSALAAYVRHHVHDEETRLFPLLRVHASPEQLDAMGATLDKVKKTAPTHAHPHAPNTPPLNLAADAVASVLDRVRDSVAARRS
jgi:hemerythrin superfamily protein